ncbi:MAG TPA: hypothetical protein VF928_13105 [Usitatibacteraceae bacterium]
MPSYDRNAFERRAHLLRRQEISRLLNAGFSAISDLLRRNHEQWLRHRSRRVKLRSANGTPV